MIKKLVVSLTLVAVVMVIGLFLHRSDCNAQGNCAVHKWQQTGVSSCTCWYKSCGGTCKKSGSFTGSSCNCPVISSCSVDGSSPVQLQPTLAFGPIHLQPTPAGQPEQTCLHRGSWYTAGEIWAITAGQRYMCLADGSVVRFEGGYTYVATVWSDAGTVYGPQPWPGGLMGCRNTYGFGWKLSRSGSNKGQCVYEMRTCISSQGEKAVIDAYRSCESLNK